MTVKLSISARRRRQRAAAKAYGEFLRGRSPEELAVDREMIESSNDIALRDAEWTPFGSFSNSP
jgi:hypothetical protein